MFRNVCTCLIPHHLFSFLFAIGILETQNQAITRFCFHMAREERMKNPYLSFLYLHFNGLSLCLSFWPCHSKGMLVRHCRQGHSGLRRNNLHTPTAFELHLLRSYFLASNLALAIPSALPVAYQVHKAFYNRGGFFQ